MISSSPQRTGLRRSLATFVSVAVAVFALLSLVGGLIAPSVSADDDGLHEPTQDVQDPSDWESCGDNCLVPEFICPPGHSGPSDDEPPTCTVNGKDSFEPIPDAFPGITIECPEGQYVAFEAQLTAENANAPGPPLDSQYCSEPTVDLLVGAGISCPDGYTGDMFFPQEEFPLEPTPEEIDALLAAAEPPVAIELPPPPRPTPAPTPTSGLDVDETIVVPTPAPEFVEFDYPMCTNPEGDTVGAIVRGVLSAFPFEPDCEGDGRLYSGPDGYFCRAADGTDSDITIVPYQAPVCGPDQVEFGVPPYTGCTDATVEAYPACPVGYFTYYGSPDGTPICTNDEALIDEIVALPVSAPDCGVACESAVEEAEDAAGEAASAAADAAALTDCPAFAQLTDGTCANVIYSSLPADYVSAPVAPAPAPTAVVGVVQQPATVVQPSFVQAVVQAPVVAHASNYGFGSSLPATSDDTAKKATAATLAHTGTETTTFLYVALSLIAAGAVAMGSRRRDEAIG